MEANELTKEEKALILSLLRQVNINAMQPDSVEMAALCRSIANKLEDKEKET